MTLRAILVILVALVIQIFPARAEVCRQTVWADQVDCLVQVMEGNLGITKNLENYWEKSQMSTAAAACVVGYQFVALRQMLSLEELHAWQKELASGLPTSSERISAYSKALSQTDALYQGIWETCRTPQQAASK